jgi:hypothetical protein
MTAAVVSAEQRLVFNVHLEKRAVIPARPLVG